jgi:fucose 4-O-acetylase-like acetyltransferase
MKMNNSFADDNFKRVSFIDIAKGLSILIVVLGHTLLLGNSLEKLNIVMGIFRLPFFFFLSGIFFSTKKNFLSYSIIKFDGLVKPFISTIVLVSILRLMTSNATSTFHHFLRMLYGTGDSIGWPWSPMWFLPHLWTVFVFSSALLNMVDYDQQKKLFKFALLLFLLLIGSYIIKTFFELNIHFFGPMKLFTGLPFSLDLVFFSSFYFILGYTIKKHVINFKANYFIFLIGCMFIYISVFHFDAYINLNQRIIDNPLFAIPSSLIGIYCALTISQIISNLRHLNRAFLILGVNSLFILIFHAFIFMHINAIPLLIFKNIFIAFLMSLIIPIIFGVLISKSSLILLFFKPLKNNKLIQKMNEKYFHRDFPLQINSNGNP